MEYLVSRYPLLAKVIYSSFVIVEFVINELSDIAYGDVRELDLAHYMNA